MLILNGHNRWFIYHKYEDTGIVINDPVCGRNKKWFFARFDRVMRSALLLVMLLLLSDACVDRLFFDLKESSQGTIVVDGQITDEPGPYSVRLFRMLGADAVLNNMQPVFAKSIAILDDTGMEEILRSTGGGVYQTDSNGIRGVIGRSYHIRIELPDGDIFESTPEEMSPAGEIDSVYYEFESFLPLSGPTQYGFRIFINAHSPNNINGYIRWRYSGAYLVESFPELNKFGSNCSILVPLPNPLPCSGFVFTGSFLKKENPCACCFCWVTDFETKPKLNNDIIATGGVYKKVEMGYVPFNQWTFGHGKYMVKIEQMSLSRNAFEFWKTFKDQKEGSASLFQPSFGRAQTNIFSTQSKKEAIGIFSASAIHKKVLFLTSADSKIPVPPYDIEPPEENCALWRSCVEVFVNASTTPPKEWN